METFIKNIQCPTAQYMGYSFDSPTWSAGAGLELSQAFFHQVDHMEEGSARSRILG